jgi:cell division ATPase FtsA
MQIDIKEAETIKLEHATLIEEETTDKDTQLDHAFLKEIVMARYEEIFDKINNKLEDMDKDGRLPG